LIAGVIASITALNYFAVKAAGGNFGIYNDTVRSVDLGIPFKAFLISFFPLLVLIAVGLTSSRYRKLAFCLFAVSFICVFNHWFGYNNHPYRFIPYSFPVWSVLSVIGIQQFYQHFNRRSVIKNFGVALVSITLIWGMVFNWKWFKRYGWVVTPLDSGMIAIAKQIETIHEKNPKAKIWLDETVVPHALYIASLTGVKLNTTSFLIPPTHYPVLNTVQLKIKSQPELWKAAGSLKMDPVDYIVSLVDLEKAPKKNSIPKPNPISLGKVFIYEKLADKPKFTAHR
jgi:hypothetical protein